MFAAKVLNQQAVADSPVVGALLLVAVIALFGIIAFDAQRWKKFWFRFEDPRAIGLFRIVFAAAVLLNLYGMWENIEFLFSDEGMFLTEDARRTLASKQFPRDGASAWAFLRGPRYSLLLFFDSPRAVWTYVAGFQVVMVLFMFGVASRVTGWLGFLGLVGLMHRNPVYWTGADLVYRVFFFYLVLARSGAAYSVDNFLRRRRAQRAGTPVATYLRIPAWPRMLMILQLATVYLWTGSAKTGSVWARGDSLYFALNLDHFARVPTQMLAAVFGTNVFRLMTWTVHFWQIGFPLMVMALIARWALREGLAPPSGWRRVGLRASWWVLGLSALGVLLVAMPTTVGFPSRGTGLIVWRVGTTIAWVGLMALIHLGWQRLRDAPAPVTLWGHATQLDLDRILTTLLGRRLWLGLGVMFHGHIFFLMNIGMFAPIMFVAYLSCLNGSEVGSILGAIGQRLRVKRQESCAPGLDGPRAYGRVGQLLIGTFLTWQIGALMINAIPNKGITSSFRSPLQKVVRPYLSASQTAQSWNMFAPNPTRTNVFLNVLVTDKDGEVWDMRQDANSPRNKATPWLFYSRHGKVTRRIAGDGKWYQKWYARAWCRTWALEHDGELPKKIELVRTSYRIPKPEQVRKRGYYRPAMLLERTGTSRVIYTERCGRNRASQVPDEIAARHGL